MKKQVIKSALLLVTLAMTSMQAYSQDCPLLLKDGNKLKLKVRTYSNSLVYDQKFQKEKKEDKKNEMVAAFNKEIESGAKAPANVTDIIYTAKGGKASDGNLAYMLTTTIAGTDYSSYIVCSGDTLYLSRNVGPVEMPDGKGGIYGHTIQGVQKLPLKLKVGDVLPSYSDISVIYPSTTDITVKKQVFSHYTSNTSKEFGFYTDSRTNVQGFGSYLKTSSQAVYNSIDVNVRKTVSGSGHAVNYAVAMVTAEEDVTVNGKKYRAYVIDSEKWLKVTLTEDFATADESVAREQKAQSEKIKDGLGKFMTKKGYTNSLGYVVTYIREWYVPEIGVVRTVAYDTFGVIANETVLTGLE